MDLATSITFVLVIAVTVAGVKEWWMFFALCLTTLIVVMI